jgi:hypothetical protein
VSLKIDPISKVYTEFPYFRINELPNWKEKAITCMRIQLSAVDLPATTNEQIITP